ncbi:MAG: hypothetical protein M1823_002382 [Watsoniomyces obsoletus]|nr:MAG: hypothetical protein M1823_002382 [Watsoniomyces obsoletus]
MLNVIVVSVAAPSAVVAAIQSTGRDAILRGSGASNSAAVCILETQALIPADAAAISASRVRGLARMVQVSPSLTLFDITVKGLRPGKYWATIRETGNISEGAASTGGIWGVIKSQMSQSWSRDNSVTTKPDPKSTATRGVLGALVVGQSGMSTVFLERPIEVWEMVGRGLVVSKQLHGFSKDDPDILVGVIARSAGVWENDKTVCSCSGKTVWEERRENINRGML